MKKLWYLLVVTISIIGILFPVLSYAQTQKVKEVEERLLKQAAENIEQYRKGDAVIQFKTYAGKVIKNSEVEISQKTHDFLFGCEIEYDTRRYGPMYKPELYKERFKELFNFATFGIYWGRYESKQGMPYLHLALPDIEWCKANGITVKGHDLVWIYPSGVPNWLISYPKDVREQFLKVEILNLVSGFSGDIDIWDVVNEPVNTISWDNIGKKEIESSSYLNEPIEEIIGYVEKSFRWANFANPKANLIANEYYTIARKDVRERFYRLLEELKKRNTPINGIGIQAHEPREMWYPPEDIWETYDYLGSLGYSIHATEFIPQSSGKEITGGWRTGVWTLDTQAEFAEQFYKLSFGHPLVVSINWWGLSDRRIWLEGGGLIDEEYNPKPVYNRLMKLIHDEWKTKISISTDDNGEIRFRGFYGDYDIMLKTADGTERIITVHLAKNEENRWVFTVSD